MQSLSLPLCQWDKNTQHQTCHVKVLSGIWAEGAWAFACVNSIFYISQAWGDEGHWGRALESTQTQLTVLSLKEKKCSWVFFSFLTKNNRRKIFKNIILLTATHPQTTIKITTVLCLSRTLAMWMLWMHLPFLALCRTEFWDWNLLFPLFKATLPAAAGESPCMKYQMD